MEESLRQTAESLRESLDDAARLGLREHEPINQLMQKMARIAGTYPIPNFAVEFCTSAYLKQTRENIKRKASPGLITRKGQLAYCSVLPRLSDAESIRDFIACVVNGMAIGAIPSPEGTRLLYGAQVAYSAQPAQKRYKKRTKSTQNKPGNQPIKPSGSAT